jgi:Tol biopolymer transport system component
MSADASGFEAAVTWVHGTAVRADGKPLDARGGPRFKRIQDNKYNLRPGELVTARGSSWVEYYVKSGGSSVYCRTNPSRGKIRIQPASGVLVDFGDGSSTCGVFAAARSCIRVKKNIGFLNYTSSQPKSTCGSSSASRAFAAASPTQAVRVFQVAAGGATPSITVRQGLLVVAGPGTPAEARKQSVAVGVDARTVLGPHGPSQPERVPQPPPAASAVVAQVGEPLPATPLPPPAPSRPNVSAPHTSSIRVATFRFSATGTGLVYSCAVDAGDFRVCTNPFRVAADSAGRPLQPGTHVLRVKATDTEGRTGPEQRFAWVIDDSKIAFETDGFDIYSMNTDGSDAVDLTDDPAVDKNPVWSPTRDAIAFESSRDPQTVAHLFVLDLRSKALTELPSDARFDGNPSWSPDGKQIAFESTRDGNSEIYTIDLATGVARRLTNDAGVSTDAAWSPAGDRIAFADNRTGSYQIYTVKPDGTGEQLLRPPPNGFNELGPAWSPQAKRIAFSSNRDGESSKIYTMRSDGTTEPRPLTTSGLNDHYPTWAPDGREIAFYREGEDGQNHIFVVDAVVGEKALRIALNPDIASTNVLAPDWSRASPTSSAHAALSTLAPPLDELLHASRGR